MSDQIPDFNQYHSPSDWGAVAAEQPQGVIFRASSPDGEDTMYQANRQGAESVGLPWLAYHRPLPGADPVAEADKFNGLIGALPAGCGLAVDLEPDWRSGTSWDGLDLQGFAVAFLNQAGASDYAPLWYAGVNLARQFGLAALDPTWKYWAAHYNVSSPDLSNLPDAPLWQHTDSGSFAGVSPVDLSVLRHGSFADLLYQPAAAVPAVQLNIQWRGSPNFSPGRDGHDIGVAPAYVVLHTMVGTLAGADGRFQQASQQASAHYGVSYDGATVYQWVKESDGAWHSGDYGMNMDSVGIEHEDQGNYDAARPDGLYASSAELVREICTHYGIPIVRTSVGGSSGILDHRQVSSTACPDALDTDRIIREASAPASPGGDTVSKQEVLDGNAEYWKDGVAFGMLTPGETLKSTLELQRQTYVLLEQVLAKELTADAIASALIAKLPPGQGGPALDVHALASAVVNELGAKIAGPPAKP